MYPDMVINESPAVQDESESVLEELSDQSCATKLLPEETSAVQLNFDREECYLPSSEGTVANINQVETITEEHGRLSYVKPMCVTTATN